MSAYAHQMEREFSGLSSRGSSELGSRYAIESGFYMTSLAAIIFLASLLAVGVMMVTLLITLSVMLQNCETRSSGIVEVQKLIESFSYCNILDLHARLNGLEATEFPSICRDEAISRIKHGIYLRELKFTIQMALTYFESITPLDGKGNAVLIHIDEILDLKHRDHSLQLEQDGYQRYIEEAKYEKHLLILELYSKLKVKGYSMVLLSRKPEKKRNATVRKLTSTGYTGWSRLIMRADAEANEDTREYLMKGMEDTGRDYHVRGVIGDLMDVLPVSRMGVHLFKLPSIVYYNFEDHNERKAESVTKHRIHCESSSIFYTECA